MDLIPGLIYWSAFNKKDVKVIVIILLINVGEIYCSWIKCLVNFSKFTLFVDYLFSCSWIKKKNHYMYHCTCRWQCCASFWMRPTTRRRLRHCRRRMCTTRWTRITRVSGISACWSFLSVSLSTKTTANQRCLHGHVTENIHLWPVL